MRDATHPAARRGLTLGALAHTLTSLRALLARRLAPPSHRPAALPALPPPAGLDRRAAPSWMSDAPHPTPSWTPDLVRAPAPPREASPAQGAHPAPGPHPASGVYPPSGPYPAEPWPPEAAAPVAMPPAAVPQPLPQPLPAAAVRAAVPAVEPVVMPVDLPVALPAVLPPMPVPARPPEPPRPAGPGPDMEDAWLAIPPAGPARTVLTRVRRQAAESRQQAADSLQAAAPRQIPESRSEPRPAPARPEADLRFTRTPDHVLQARRRRREEEALAREAAQREAEEQAAAEHAAAEAAAEAERLAAEAQTLPPLPRWRQPYVLPPGVRFTRTPDHLLRHASDEGTPAPVFPEITPLPEPEPVQEIEPIREVEQVQAPELVQEVEPILECAPVPEPVAGPSEPAPEPAAVTQTASPPEAEASFGAARALLSFPWPPVVPSLPEALFAPEASPVDEPQAVEPVAAPVPPAEEAGPVPPPAAEPPLYRADAPFVGTWAARVAVQAAPVPAEFLPAELAPAAEGTVPAVEPAAPRADDAVVPDAAAAPEAAPPRESYPVEVLLRHDWRQPLAADQDNRPAAADEAAPIAEPQPAPATIPALAEVPRPEPLPVPEPAPAAAPQPQPAPTVPAAMSPSASFPPVAYGLVRRFAPAALPVPVAQPLPEAPAAPAPLPAEAPPEPSPVVIGNAGLDLDLGLDADDAEDEDDIIAPLAYPTPLPRPAPRAVAAPYEMPALDLLAEARASDGSSLDADFLQANAVQLQQVIQDFGVRGEILAVRPGPVVTLYELEPAPGTKSSRVISLADDIARSMSAVSARVAVVQGRNAIGIELPNAKRETVYLRELLA
ncbi:DNA translocase FtsK, partial [Methylobacterium oryzisoli]